MAAPVEVARVFRFMMLNNMKARLTFMNQCQRVVQRSMSSDLPSSSSQGKEDKISSTDTEKSQQISQAMKAYLERAKAHDEFMTEEINEFEMGKRHLANMMSVDADSMTQEDIDKAIEYLMPSGLHDKKARPMMRHPREVIPQRKAAQFGMDGRPFHSLFYTAQPNYYNLMKDLVAKIEELKAYEDKMLNNNFRPHKSDKFLLAGSQSLSQDALEKELNEQISEEQFEQFNKVLVRLAGQSYSNREKTYILQYRKALNTKSMTEDIPPLKEDEDGRKYMDATGKRKSTVAEVRVYAEGSGKVIVNGQDLLSAFPRLMDREQILFPLQLTETVGEVDVEARVTEGGPSSQSGAIRLATSRALTSHVSQDTNHQMRLAGLLTKDPRIKERLKPGQEKARKKFTWKKR